MQYLATLLLGATLASAAPHSIMQTSPLMSRDDARMSSAEVNAIYKTCWNGQLQWPLGNTPAPCKDVVTQQLNIFKKPDTKPNTLIVNNYCDYDIYWSHFAGASQIGSGVLKKGVPYESPLSGSVFKASKRSDGSKDVLIEYNVAADGKLWYDMSLITCLGSDNGKPNADTSACAGHEDGLQLGNKNGKSFQCAKGSWCDDQAYLYQENLCKKQNPVFQCSPSFGLTMEFCAGKKA